jgi:hypothetical protein
MLIEIKRNSHIKIREKNRLLTYMHGPNFNEMLETKENILRLTYIMKIDDMTILTPSHSYVPFLCKEPL